MSWTVPTMTINIAAAMNIKFDLPFNIIKSLFNLLCNNNKKLFLLIIEIGERRIKQFIIEYYQLLPSDMSINSNAMCVEIGFPYKTLTNGN